ncbi:MAG: hypothetical protein HY821_07595 [Acidobacteria bacterium]|nr:hypothetical protein [Acidobacteriota bacterium]
MVKPQWLLLGAETLLGKEIRDLVDQRKLPIALRTASAEASEAVLTSNDDEVEVLEPLSAELVDDARVLLLGASLETNRKALALAHGLAVRPAVIDLTGDFEDLPASVVRSPLLESPRAAYPADALHAPAHPAAAALARLLSALHAAHPVKAAVANLFEPASQRGHAGVDELHKQSVNLFNFQPLPKTIFDAQVTFNMMPRFGAQATANLEKNELRIERHLASLLGPGGVPLPSLRLIHAPVFHAYCVNLWVEFARRPAVKAVREVLSEAGFDVRDAAGEPASNVGIAGQSGIAVSDIAEDRSSASGLWLWAAFDNIRALADEALLVAGLLSRAENAK